MVPSAASNIIPDATESTRITTRPSRYREEPTKEHFQNKIRSFLGGFVFVSGRFFVIQHENAWFDCMIDINPFIPFIKRAGNIVHQSGIAKGGTRVLK
jgi:hypothetical protein